MTRAIINARPLIVPHPTWRTARQRPSFHLDFKQGTVDLRAGNLGTFSRALAKNVWNGTQFVSVAANVPALQRDPATGLWGYLHEPAATNLFLNSATPATQTIAVTAQQYTLSFVGTGTITLSGASTAGPLVGIGANPPRARLTFTPTAGNLTLTLSGSISWPQLETGPLVTSPIITSGSAVTRPADVWQYTGAQFSSWHNQAGGSIFMDGIASNNGSRIVYMEDAAGTGVERFDNRILANRLRTNVTSNSTEVSLLDAGNIQITYPERVRQVMAVNASTAWNTFRGTTATAALANGVPEVGQMWIGAFRGTATNWNGLIREICYWPTVLSDAVQQSLAPAP